MTAKTEPLGSTWSIPAKAGERVEIARPDTSVVVVVAGPEGAQLVLDQAGKYVCGESTVTAK